MRQLEKKTRIGEMRKQELIIATLNSLCRHGYLNSTINTISDESGLSRGLISHYFSSKDDLLAAAHRYYLQNADDFYRHLSQNAKSSFQRLYFAVAGPFLRDLGYAEILLHYMSAGSMVPEIRAHHRELWGKYRAFIARRLASVAQEKNIEIDTRLQAFALTQLSDGLWLGQTLEEGYSQQDCLTILRKHLCDLFGENPEDHALFPDFDLETYSTSAPLPKRITDHSG